jgi:hypothetical protein
MAPDLIRIRKLGSEWQSSGSESDRSCCRIPLGGPVLPANPCPPLCPAIRRTWTGAFFELPFPGAAKRNWTLPCQATFPAGMFALSRHRKAPGKGAWPLEVESLGQRPHDRLD